MVLIATGRMDKLKNEVQAILDFHNLKFHDVFCNWGPKPLSLKTRLFEQRMRQKSESYLI
jgi:hypothetical protein